MDREEILKRSRRENEGGRDEYEAAAADAASKIGMAAGAPACVVMVFLGSIVLHLPQVSFAGWTVYFAMFAARHLVMYKKLERREYLTWGIICLAAAVGFCAAVVLVSVL